MNVAELQSRYVAACTLNRPVNEAAIIAALQQFFGAHMTINVLASAHELSRIFPIPAAPHRGTHQAPAQSSAATLDTWCKKKTGCKAAWRTQSATAARQQRDALGLKPIMDFTPDFFLAYEWTCKLPDSATIAIGAAYLRKACLFEEWLPMLEAFEAGAWQLARTNNRVAVIPLPEVQLGNGVCILAWPGLEVRFDEQGRLHCSDGPALIWRDKWPQSLALQDDLHYYLHGVEVQPDVILRPYRNADKIRTVQHVTGSADPVLDKRSTPDRIDQLLPEQAALWPDYVAHWEAIGLATQPADRAQAEQGVRLSYAAAGLRPPKQIIWTLSPVQSAILFAEIFTNQHSIFDQEVAARVAQHIYQWTTKRVMDSTHWMLSFRSTEFMQYLVPTSRLTRMRDKVRNQVRDRILLALPTREQDLWQTVSTRPNMTPLGPIGRVRTPLLFGQHEAPSFVEYAFYREVCGLVAETEPLVGPMLIAQAANWWLPAADICWISERPRRMQFDADNRLHSADGPAIEYPDGWGMYFWNGMQVSENIIRRLQTPSVEDIEHQPNTAIRRAMLERYGEARYIEERGAQVIHADAYGILYRCDFRYGEPLVMVRVVNRTPEPDGSYKHYWLRVPPTMRTAHEAVAWTFGLTPEQYRPSFES